MRFEDKIRLIVQTLNDTKEDEVPRDFCEVISQTIMIGQLAGADE